MSISIRVVGTADLKDLKRAERELDLLRRKIDPANSSMMRLSRTMQDAGRGMTRVGRTLSRSVAAPLAGIGIASIRSAMSFEESFAKIQGLVGVAAEDIDELAAAARTLGPEYGVSANAAAEALFFITSAGLRGATAIETLESSLKASAVGLGETAVVADLATSALNAYGEENLSATEATDVLTNAVRLGKLEPSELGAAMGQVLPIASAMGVEFHEVGAAFAAMSRTGTNAEVAATQLRQIMSAILSPTAGAASALADVGLSAEELQRQLRDEGLLSLLQTLVTRFDGNVSATEAVFGNIRALSGVLDLMGSNVEATAGIFEGMTQSTGVLNEAFGITADTAAFQFRQSLEELREAGIGIGQDLMPIAEDLLGWVGEMVAKFQALAPEQQDFLVKAGLIAAIGLPVAAALGVIITAVGTLTAAIVGMSAATAIATGGLSLLAGAIGYAAFQRAMMTDEEKEAADAHREEYIELWKTRNGYAELAAAARDAGAAHREAGESARTAGRSARLLRQEHERLNAEMEREVGRFESQRDRQREERERRAAEEEQARLDAIRDAMAAATSQYEVATEVTIELDEELRALLQTLNDTYVGTSDAGDAFAEYVRDVLAAGTATAETEREIERLGSAIRQELNAALQEAEGRLSSAQSLFDNYRDSISRGITEGNTLADAARRQTDAIRRLSDAEKAYADAHAEGDPERLAEAAAELEEAERAQGTFADFLSQNVLTAEAFAGQINALRTAGASLEVTQQIAQLGAETGGRIIAELLAGGAEAIKQANALTAAVAAAAADAGTVAAQQFYGAGVRAAQALVDGIKSEMEQLDDLLAEVVRRIATAFEGAGATPTSSGAPAGPIPTTSTTSTSSTTGGTSSTNALGIPRTSPMHPLNYDWAAEKMATGGFVTGPTFALVGEAGPEVVMPLDWFESRYGSGGAQVVNITVTSADPEAVVEAIRRYTRRNGPLSASVRV